MLAFIAVAIVVCFICFYDNTKTLSYIPLQNMTATLIYISIPGVDEGKKELREGGREGGLSGRTTKSKSKNGSFSVKIGVEG